MVDIASTLASDFLQAQGWACIICASATTTSKVLAPPSTSVTVGGLADRDEPGIRIWMQRKQADKTMVAFLSRDQRARRRPRCEGLIVDAVVAVVDNAIRAVAFSLGYALVGDEFIHDHLALVSTRIEAALPRVTKGLSKEYRAARSSGTALPRYQDWLVARLRPAIRAGAS